MSTSVVTPVRADEVDQLIADVLNAVRRREYGTVTVLVSGRQVVRLERNEERRLITQLPHPF